MLTIWKHSIGGDTIRSGFDSYDRTFHEPRLIYWIKYMKSWRLNRSKETNRITQSSSFLSARQIARNQKLSKKISHKKHIAIPITRGRDKRLTMPKGFGAFMMNQCAVLWCGRTLWVALRLHTVTCLASLYVGRGSEWGGGGAGVSKCRLWVKIS